MDVKQAVKLASDYLRSLPLIGDITDIRLEGVQFSEKRKQWFITLSFSRFPDREFKRVDVDAKSGEIKKMALVVL